MKSHKAIAFLIALTVLSSPTLHANSLFDCEGNLSRERTSALEKFKSVFGTTEPIIGMIHLAGKTGKEIIQRALDEMAVYEKAGVHAVIVENYHGEFTHVERVLQEAQGRFPKLVVGVNVLPNDFEWAFILADTYGAKFIQLDYVAGRYKSYFGRTIELDEDLYMNYREHFKNVLVLGGVHPKYYVPVKGSSLRKDLESGMSRADAIVVTGEGTGLATPLKKIKKFREIMGDGFPLVIGAGINLENGKEQLALGNGAIVGSYFKDGRTTKPVNPDRVAEIMDLASSVSSKK